MKLVFLLFILVLILLVAAPHICDWCSNDISGGGSTNARKYEFTLDEVKNASKEAHVRFEGFDIYDLKRGMDEELEHGLCDPETNVTNDDPVITAKIAWAHLKRKPMCYSVY